MELPNSLRDLGEILKTAIKLELKSDAGKVNFAGMFFSLVLAISATVTTWLEDFIRMFKPKAVASPTDWFQLYIVFIVLVMFCVCMVTLDHSKREPPD